MLFVHIDDTELMSVEEQIALLERQQDETVRLTGLEKMRHLLKREYIRNAITSFEYIEYSRRLKKLSAPDYHQ